MFSSAAAAVGAASRSKAFGGITALVLIAAALWPATARAEAGAQGDAMIEARRHAEQARVQYDLGRFEEALAEYEAAYELAPAPGVLFNMGQCHRQLGRHERAVFFFEGFLRGAPNAPNREMVEGLITEERAALERERAEAEAAAAAAAQAEAEAAAAAAATPAIPEEGEEEEEEIQRPIYRRWWFWTIMGGILAAGAVAGGVGAWAAGREEPPEYSLGVLDAR